MKESHDGPSTVLRALFQVPVWLYQGHLGFLFFGRLIAIAHRGRTSGNRYVSGLEVLERSDNELFVFSAWGTTSDWYRNIAVNGVETLWDGTKRTDALVRIVDADEADGILSNYEKAHPRLARFFMPRMYPGYDFTDESRRTLAATGTIVAFSRVDSVNDRIGSYGWRDVWPRPSTESLPPGQRVSTVMPRFSSRPTVAPPRIPERPQLEVTGAVTTGLQLDLGRLHQLPRTEMVEDFHCVTTWTIPQLTWAGWKFADVWEQLITPDAAPDPQATHVRVRGADGYWAVLDLEDALGSEVMLADSLEGRPLDPLHGAPLRLVSPRQYAYKSVKHVTAISVHNRAPRRYGGAIEHPRARAALEERTPASPAGYCDGHTGRSSFPPPPLPNGAPGNTYDVPRWGHGSSGRPDPVIRPLQLSLLLASIIALSACAPTPRLSRVPPASASRSETATSPSPQNSTSRLAPGPIPWL